MEGNYRITYPNGKIHVGKKEVESIRLHGANDPADDYNRWPRFRLRDEVRRSR